MRCMLYAKENYPYEQYENAFGELWRFLWIEHKDVSKPDVLAECLGKHFNKEDVEKSKDCCIGHERSVLMLFQSSRVAQIRSIRSC